MIDHDPDELSAYALGALDAGERAVVEAHLRGCGICRGYLAELLETTDALDQLPVETFVSGPPDSDRELRRALRRLRAETGRPAPWLTATHVAVAVVLLLIALVVGVLIGRAATSTPGVPNGLRSAGAPAASPAEPARTPWSA